MIVRVHRRLHVRRCEKWRRKDLRGIRPRHRPSLRQASTSQGPVPGRDKDRDRWPTTFSRPREWWWTWWLVAVPLPIAVVLAAEDGRPAALRVAAAVAALLMAGLAVHWVVRIVGKLRRGES